MTERSSPNLATMALYMARSWTILFLSLFFARTFLVALGADESRNALAISAALTGTAFATIVSGALISIALERAVLRFRPMEPLYCSLYDERFWNHERYWKLNFNAFLAAFNGTPVKPLFARMQGARVGKRIFDDGAHFSEPWLVEIGDDCTLNRETIIQSHSLEDGTFKSERSRIGHGCTIATSGFVHYGTTMHDGSVLEADGFLMKGSVVESGSHWRGNPARDVSTGSSAEPDPTIRELEGAI